MQQLIHTQVATNHSLMLLACFYITTFFMSYVINDVISVTHDMLAHFL